MPKRKTPVEKPEKQFERFLETARKHEIETERDPLNQAFKKLTPKTKDHPPQKN